MGVRGSEEGKEGGREGGRKGGREEGRKKGREEERKRGREGWMEGGGRGRHLHIDVPISQYRCPCIPTILDALTQKTTREQQ